MPHFIDFKRRFIADVSEELKEFLRGNLERNRSNGCLDWSSAAYFDTPKHLDAEFLEVWNMVCAAEEDGFDEIWIEDREEYKNDDNR